MAERKRKKIALITTVWGWRNHANHMGERFLNGYPCDGKWHRPEMDIVGVYVDQSPAEGEDLSLRRAKKHFSSNCNHK